MADRASRIVLIGLALITLVVYLPLWSAGWVYEDPHWQAVVQQPLIWKLPSRAFTAWTYRATWQLVGLRADVFHLTNVVLHLVNGWLVYLMGRRMGSRWLAVSAAAVVWLHPINSEAVSYLAARSDLLLTLGTLIGVLALLWNRWLLALVGLAIAVTSKELGLIAIPLVLMVRRSSRPIVIAGALGVCAVLVWRGRNVLHWIQMGPATGGPLMLPSDWFLRQLSALAQLGALIVWPVGLSIDHDVQASAVWLTVAVVGLLALVMLAWRARGTPTGLGAAWILVSLAPRLFIPTRTFLTEPQLYLPMVGVSLILGSVAGGWIHGAVDRRQTRALRVSRVSANPAWGGGPDLYRVELG